MDAHFKKISDAAHARLKKHKSSFYSRYGKNGAPPEANKAEAQEVRGSAMQSVAKVPEKRKV